MITAVAAAALLGLSACGGAGGGATEQPPAPQAKPLQSFDPCTFLTPDELTSFGVETKAEEFTQVDFQPGCKWRGDQMILSLQKNSDEAFGHYEKTGTFDEFTRKTLGGRQGARMLTPGATGQGVCNAVVSAGGGIVLYQVTARGRSSVDACGEVEKIADQTAARLPR